jgi:hypothetical protein
MGENKQGVVVPWDEGRDEDGRRAGCGVDPFRYGREIGLQMQKRNPVRDEVDSPAAERPDSCGEST